VLLKKIIACFCIAFLSLSIYAQKDSLAVKDAKVKKVKTIDYNPLAPAKAAFYSAIFPGMGQIYNKKYWLVPLVWGGMAASLYFYIDNNSEYKRYRTAFKLREAGLNDEFIDLISRNGLINAQRQLRKNRDLSLLLTVMTYVLQIVEASVSAHLLQFNTNDNLSFEPAFVPDPIQLEAPKFGFTLTYTF